MLVPSPQVTTPARSASITLQAGILTDHSHRAKAPPEFNGIDDDWRVGVCFMSVTLWP